MAKAVAELKPEADAKPARQCWILQVSDGADVPLVRNINVLAPNFRRAAIKADNWVKAFPEYQVVSLTYSQDAVI